ncbi:NUDIX domain-containing protein [Streptomyces sp. I05A-00742]|uniref:NUDIX domain-containing protein n=1 Tax=Streptomyces sp. I05A-00742 TaxID=2732853 RepID=UPI001487EA11|nr:NUDIX domain-containing protein [Streptomyces sp. I05A-00742]
MEEPKGTAALVVNAAGEFLLHLRDDIPGICDPGAWSLLGGGREDGETPEAAIARELAEEAGLVLPGLRRYAVLPARGPDGGTGLITVFLGHWEGDARALPLTEGVMLAWFPAPVLPRLTMSPWARAVIGRYLDGGVPAGPEVSGRGVPAVPRPGPTVIRNAASGLVVHDGRVLLLHGNTPRTTAYWLPGGGQHPGETLSECAAREVFEETGVRVTPGPVLLLREYIPYRHPEVPARPDARHRVEALFWCGVTDVPRTLGGPVPDRAQAGVVWVPLDGLSGLRINPVAYRGLLPGLVAAARAGERDGFYAGDVG